MDGTGNEFMEHTRYKYLGMSDQQKGVPQPPLELDCTDTELTIELPDPLSCKQKPVSVTDAIEKRASIRNFSDDPLPLPELSYLLHCTQGIRHNFPGQATFRTVPSAGARHAFETFMLVNRVESLKPGLYRYLALSHTLVRLKSPKNIGSLVLDGCLGQNMIFGGAVTFLWCAVVDRMRWRYGERGYRYLHLDAGHVCQNLYLAAEAVDCGVCAIAAFDDDALNEALSLDGKEQFVIYCAVTGKKRDHNTKPV
ncbi:SagB/ThcOx family dehydrogenase [Candidatus Latescibacterota bacterium]